MVKLEIFDPISSVKVRIGVDMSEAMERDVRLRPGGRLIEPTSGSIGIGLAFMAAARGYRLILTMPESVSMERQKMLRYLGPEMVLMPRDKGMTGAIAEAERLVGDNDGAGMPNQFGNPAKPNIHRRTTTEPAGPIQARQSIGPRADGICPGYSASVPMRRRNR